MNEEEEKYESRSTRERLERPGAFRETAQRINPNSPLARRNATLKLKRDEQFKRAQELGGGVPLDNTLDLRTSEGEGGLLNRENLTQSTSAAQSEASRRNALPSRMRSYNPLEDESGSSFPEKKFETALQKRGNEKNKYSSNQNSQSFRDGQREKKFGKNIALLEKKVSDKAFQKRNRLTFGSTMLMFMVAIFFDILQIILTAIPFVGWIISPLVGICAWVTFYIWTSMKGWGLSDTIKNILLNFAIPVVELIPILNALPTWTLRVFLQISFLKAEDTLYNTTHGKIDKEEIKKLNKYIEIFKKAA